MGIKEKSHSGLLFPKNCGETPQPRRVLFALGANSGTNPKQQLADAVVELETRIGQGPASARRSSLLRTAALLFLAMFRSLVAL